MESRHMVVRALPHVAATWERRIDQLLLERFGIGVAQHKILVLLRNDAELGQAHMAKQLGQTEASVSRQIKLLAARGLIASRVNPHNRRQHLAMLTIKGRQIIDAAEQAIAQNAELVLAQLSAKQHKQFGELLTLLHGALCNPAEQAHMSNVA